MDAGIADGVIYPDHDTLIRTYMPNYMAYLESSEEARKEATSDNGKMQVIKCIVGQDFTAESEGTYQGLAYRKDILTTWALKSPPLWKSGTTPWWLLKSPVSSIPL